MEKKMKISNLTKGILGAAVFSLSSCLWAADSNVNTLEGSYQVAAKRAVPQKKMNKKTSTLKRKSDRRANRQSDRKGSRDTVKRRSIASEKKGDGE